MTYIVNQDPFVLQAINEIEKTFSDTVTVQNKKESLFSFGRNENVTNALIGSTIMTLPNGLNHEIYSQTNNIGGISSLSTSDVSDIEIKGHTLTGPNFSPVTQSITLNGQTTVFFSTALARIHDIKNTGGPDLIGPTFCYSAGTVTQGLPDVLTTIHIATRATKNNSEKAAATVASNEYFLITGMYGCVLEKQSGFFVEMEMQVRAPGRCFTSLGQLATKSGQMESLKFKPYLIVPKNNDLRLIAFASQNNLDVCGGIQGYVAGVV